MARGTQLQTLVSQLRAETRDSSKVSVGTDAEDNLKQILRRTQETLYDDHDWKFLQFYVSKDLAAGQRYYDMPDGLSDARITDVAVEWSGEPYPIEQGIGFQEYAEYDSDGDERSEPALRWDWRRTSETATQIEVWPIPSTNTQKLRFRGIRNLNPLVANTDRATLDDTLIVLFSAAEILASRDAKDAKLKLAAGQGRLASLLKQTSGLHQPFAIGGGDARRSMRGHTIIRVR